MRCNNFSVPPELGYKDTLRAPAKTHVKKNPFDLSNSIPIEEYLSHGSNSNQGLQQTIDQFLSTGSNFMVPTIDQVSTTTPTELRTPPPGLNMAFSTLSPSPIMATSVITHTKKGKGIALSEAPHPPILVASRPLNRGTIIQEPSMAATMWGVLKHFEISPYW
uniref:Uncharacterized protein n=1 Tax=Cannabis sativa TaxID=3483 RepID=A0A803PV65_CANSA